MREQLLKDILHITQSQKKALEEDAIEAFEVLVQKRQQKMDAVDVWNQNNPKKMTTDEEALMKEIMTCDANNRTLFDEKYELAKRKLGEIRAQKKVNNVYRNPYTRSQEEGIFFDKR